MNNLSILLYLAETLGSLGTAMTVFGVVGLILVGGTLFASTIEMSAQSRYNNKNRETGEIMYDKDYLNAKRWKDTALRWLWLPVVLFFVSMLMPSRETIYMIAASEIGEEAIQTPEFAKMRKMLNQYLDEQLTEDKETEK